MIFSGYPKIHALGNKSCALSENQTLPVYVSEKLDGSNVSIHCIEVIDSDGSCEGTRKELKLGSRTRWIDPHNKQFACFTAWVKAHEEVLLVTMKPGEVLWGEFCNNHNVLQYDRRSPFILFDMTYDDLRDNRQYITPESWALYKQKRGWDFIECTSFMFFRGGLSDISAKYLNDLLSTQSLLGGQREGVVIKHYDATDDYGQPLFAKIVKDDFKESHKEVYGDPGDSIEQTLCQLVFNEARFHKGIQRLRDNGEYTETMKDMGKLLSTIQKDIEEESMPDIATYLVGKFWPSAKKIVNHKIVTRYKQQLGMGVNPNETPNP